LPLFPDVHDEDWMFLVQGRRHRDGRCPQDWNVF